MMKCQKIGNGAFRHPALYPRSQNLDIKIKLHQFHAPVREETTRR
jgi:hypothetical protein